MRPIHYAGLPRRDFSYLNENLVHFQIQFLKIIILWRAKLKRMEDYIVLFKSLMPTHKITIYVDFEILLIWKVGGKEGLRSPFFCQTLS